MSEQFGSDLDLLNQSKVVNLKAGSNPNDAINKSQLDAMGDTKQGNLNAGAGVDLTANTIKVDLAVAGTDYGSLTLSGTGYSSLDGVYILASFKGSLSYGSANLSLDVGGNYNFYYKDNGGGVWAVIGKRDTDNIHNNGSSAESFAGWMSALTLVDPTTITDDYPSLIPDYLSVDSFFITSSSEQDESGNGTVSTATGNVTYAAGNTPAGLVFENDKLAIDFAQNLAEAESTNVLPASVAATAISEAESRARQAQNVSFSNVVAQLNGDPSKVQSAIEALKALSDALSTTLSNNQTVAATEYNNIDSLQSLAGTTGTNHGDLSHTLLPDNATTPQVFEALASAVASVRSDANASLGGNIGALLNAIGDIVAQDSTYIQAFTAIVNRLESVEGEMTNFKGTVEFYHNAEEFPLNADQLAGTETFDTVQTGFGTGQSTDVATYVSSLSIPRDVRILVSYGENGNAGAGIYVRNKDTGFLTRSTDFDESSEIEKGSVYQVLLGGSVALSTWTIVNDDSPVIGTDLIKIKARLASGVGDGSVSKVKLDDSLKGEIDNKLVGVELASQTIAANDETVITHDHKIFGDVWFRVSATGEKINFATDRDTDGILKVTSNLDSDVDVDIRFSGLAL